MNCLVYVTNCLQSQLVAWSCSMVNFRQQIASFICHTKLHYPCCHNYLNTYQNGHLWVAEVSELINVFEERPCMLLQYKVQELILYTFSGPNDSILRFPLLFLSVVTSRTNNKLLTTIYIRSGYSFGHKFILLYTPWHRAKKPMVYLWVTVKRWTSISPVYRISQLFLCSGMYPNVISNSQHNRNNPKIMTPLVHPSRTEWRSLSYGWSCPKRI